MYCCRAAALALIIPAVAMQFVATRASLGFRWIPSTRPKSKKNGSHLAQDLDMMIGSDREVRLSTVYGLPTAPRDPAGQPLIETFVFVPDAYVHTTASETLIHAAQRGREWLQARSLRNISFSSFGAFGLGLLPLVVDIIRRRRAAARANTVASDTAALSDEIN